MVLKQLLPIEEIKGWFEQNKKEILFGLLIIASAGGYWYYRNIYRPEINAKAHRVLLEIIDDVNQAQKNPELWEEIELASQTGYAQNSSSTLAPYFLALESHALAMQGKLKEAIKMNEEVEKMLSSSSDLYSFYQVRQARMKLDSPEKDWQEQGLKQLEKISTDKNSLAQDQAMYFLGLHYWMNDNKEKARKTWQALVKMFPEKNTGASIWAVKAQQKL